MNENEKIINNTNDENNPLMDDITKTSDENLYNSVKQLDEGAGAETNSDKFSDIEKDIFREIEQNPKKPKKKRSGKLNKVLLTASAVFTALSVTAASVYCIFSDISHSNISNIRNGVRPDFILNTNHKPDVPNIYVDENGRYTVEGLAEVIKPQIVEIYACSDEDATIVMGTGSGIIISDDGYIVTNTHVLDGMKSYIVKTHDEKTYRAKIAGRDAKTDIAVVKVDARGLIPAQFGNSDDVVQGESVVAVGNPAGLTGSITDGIVSGVNRKVRAESTGFEMNCIQTDAAISPGNSGGALVNMYGQVIGITSSKYASTTSEGLGFAITINEAKPIIEELITLGYVSGRVRIGITFYSTYAGYSAVMFKEEFGFDIPEELSNALWIEDVSKDCDISNTELRKNDFILNIDGYEVKDYAQLEMAIKGKAGGDTVKARCARVSDDGEISYFDIEFKLMTDTSGDY